MVTVYYSRRIQIRIRKKKSAEGEIQKSSRELSATKDSHQMQETGN